MTTDTPLTLEQFETRLYSTGRIEGPDILFDAWYGGEIDRAVLAAHIGPVWSDAEYPFTSMTQAVWRDLFDAAGYTVDGKLADRPTGATTLYRGSTPSYRRRWSWTASRDVAARFAQGYEDGGLMGRWPGNVYMVAAPPTHLLCVVNDRKESEHVVDTRGLKIREAD